MQHLGRWTHKVCARIGKWDSHIADNRCHGWAGKVRNHKDGEWLRLRRWLAESLGLDAGTTNTREYAGAPATRYHVSVANAYRHLAGHEL